MPEGVNVLIRDQGDITVVTFENPRLLEAFTIEKIGTDLYPLVEKLGCKKLILDFSKVQFFASAAVGLLINLQKKSAAIDGTLVICGLRKELRKVFELLKLTKLFTFSDTVEAALETLSTDSPP
jgi:anti-sigma B factor antagonist